MKKFFYCLFVYFIIVLYFIFNCEISNAETVLCFEKCGTVLDVFGDNDKNFFVLCKRNNNYNAICFNEQLNIEERLYCEDVNSTAYTFKDNIFYFFGEEYEIDDAEEYKNIAVNYYDFFRSVQQKRVIYYNELNINAGSAVDDKGNIYLSDYNRVNVFSPRYNLLNTAANDKRVNNISSSRDHKVIFCAGMDGLVIITENGEYAYDIYTEKIFPGKDRYFSDSEGIVYLFEDGSVKEVYNGFNGSYGSAVVGRFLFGCIDDCLTAVDLDTLEEIPIKTISHDSLLTLFNNQCVCISSFGDDLKVECFTELDVENKKRALRSISEPESNIISFMSSNHSSAVSMPVQKNGTFSESLHIDKSQKIINGIEPGYTIADMKNNLYGGHFLFYDNAGYVKKSGKIGTGYSVENTDTAEKYRIIIYGELSGEGNINSVDKKAMANNLLGKKHLDEIYTKAADINGDSKLNLKDYVALDSYLKGEYSIEQNR